MKTYVHNDTASPMYVGGALIPPGEGREVDVPPEHAPAAAPAADDADGPLRELLAHSVKTITEQLADFGDATLARLAELENAGNPPRKTLLLEIGKLQMARSDHALQVEQARSMVAAARAILAAPDTEHGPEAKEAAQVQLDTGLLQLETLGVTDETPDAAAAAQANAGA